MKSNNYIEKIFLFFTFKKQLLFIVLLSGVVSTSFILIGNIQDQPGFPLDDAWIHQTYARNIAFLGKWQFFPGEISAGSTSPLWTILLSIGFLLGQKEPFIWTFSLSILCFIGMCVITFIFFYKLKKKSFLPLFSSVFMMLEWHLLWAAGSGMETILYCLVLTSVFILLSYNKTNSYILGVLIGSIVWVRPDGITTLGPVLLVFVVQIFTKSRSWKDLITLLAITILICSGYAWFNYTISGTIFPNTFYAKQMEYSSLYERSIIERSLSIFSVPISSASALLIPGFIRSVYSSIKNKNPWLIGLILWFFGYGLIYAIRLPVTYQHGRYLIPLIPIFIIISFIGVDELMALLYSRKSFSIKVKSLLAFTLLFCSFVFIFSAQKAYKSDLKTIQKLMIEPALWINTKTEEDAIIAAHDIGAMGYYSGRRIIDLAGLLQPDVIPIIRNETELLHHIQVNNSNYLIIFKNWYETLENSGSIVKSFEYAYTEGIEEVLIIKLFEN